MDKLSIMGVAAPCSVEEISGAAINQETGDGGCSNSENLVANRMKAGCSFGNEISTQEIDFMQDSADYQWLADYGYRDNGNSLRTSILSSLSGSFGDYNDSDGYKNISRDIDVHLAHTDMDDFRYEDIHSLLHHTLPQICNSVTQNEQHGEMFASLSDSLQMKCDLDCSLSLHSTSQEDSNVSTGSFCKSEILFSPVKEAPPPLVSFSTDSLDCGEDHDIMLTCQANKDNYTIAFEGSTLMDGSLVNESLCSFATISQEGKTSDSSSLNPSTDTSNSGINAEKFTNKPISENLTRSASPYTTWQKLKENSSESVKKQETGSDNAMNACLESSPVTTSCVYLKSQSLPNLSPMKNYLMRHKNSLDKCINSFEINTNCLDGRVKLYSLSNSDYRKNRCGNILGNGVSTDLISKFMNQKYYKNSSGCNFQPWFTPLSNSIKNQSEMSSTLLDSVSEDKQESDITTVRENRFEDSLVHDQHHSKNVTMSFTTSSHFSGLENFQSNNRNTKKHNTKSKDNKRDHFLTTSIKKKLMKNKSFDSAINSLADRRRSHLANKKNSSSAPCPIQIMDKSMQTSLLIDFSGSRLTNEINSTNADKPVFVMYPNYTLPDLSFLRDHAAEIDLKNIFLMPAKFTPSPTTEHTSALAEKFLPEKQETKRPCSCPDFDTLRNRDYNHIRDWKSLMFLLPREYCQLLIQMPEMEEYLKDNSVVDFGRSLLCTSGGLIMTDEKHSSVSSTSTDIDVIDVKTTCISSFFTTTQPSSSGYRGSSGILLTDSTTTPSSIPFYMNSKQECKGANTTLDRPPLPKGILRNPASVKSKKNFASSKRYSMFELREDESVAVPFEKRRSLPSQLNLQRKLKSDEQVCSEDEGVGSASSHCDSPCPQQDDARKLEQLLETSMDWNKEDVIKLRNQVNHCLGQNIRKTVSFVTPPNSPNSSAAAVYKPYQMKLQPGFDIPIHEESELTKDGYCDHTSSDQSYNINSLNYKKGLIDGILDATKQLETAFSVGYDSEAISEIVLKSLCPALYAILNHGLKSTLETAFGNINNSVWHVIEASSQQGPMTRALHELVLKLNNDDVLTEGLLKFNAFIFGLLNVCGLDAWFSYLRTCESVLRKHYLECGLLLSASRCIGSDRQLVDQLLGALKPLAEYEFKLDLLYECRQLHTSLMQLGKNPATQTGYDNDNNRTSWVLKKIVRSLQNVTGHSNDEENPTESVRPRSCVDSSSGFTFNDIASTVKKRWSGIQFGSKLVSAFERLGMDDDDDYTDSLENTLRQRIKCADVNTTDSVDEVASVAVDECNRKILQPEQPLMITSVRSQGGKFKQLQKKWEMLATEQEISTNTTPVQDIASPSKICDTSFTISKSKIPRLVTSPVRPPSLPFGAIPQSSIKKQSPVSPGSNIPTLIGRKSTVSATNFNKSSIARPKTGVSSSSRGSSIDQNGLKQSVRPNSLSQRSIQLNASEIKSDVKNRSSNILNKRNVSHKYVKTLSHRLPSDSGHLSYNEGEKLRVILDVDEKWILCCRGDQKGLVPRSAVLPISGHF